MFNRRTALERLGRLVAPGLLFAAAWGAPPVLASTPPTLVSIAIDGDTSDWTEVLANPVTASRDDDGSSVPCGLSLDRDCPVDSTSLDLLRFAWTWDDTYLFLYFERRSTSASADYVLVYLDLDRNGLMEATDRVLRLRLRTDMRNIDSDLLDYEPVGLPGDPLGDASGLADGWAIAGSATRGGGNVAPGLGRAPGAAIYECALRWDRLGLPAGSPMFFHVATAEGTRLPGDLEDNMGGPGGLVGDTAFRAVKVATAQILGVAAGTTATIRHAVANTGNLAGTIDLRGTSSVGFDIAWSLDADDDGTCETALGTDIGGDGTFTPPTDFLAPAADSDGNGVLDLGPMAAGSTRSICLDVAIPPTAGGATDTLDLLASHASDPSAESRLSDLLRVGDITIAADQQRTGVAGQVAWFAHGVKDNLGADSTVNFSTVSVLGWPPALFADPDADGDPADAFPLSDSDGDGRVDTLLPAGGQQAVLLRIAIPAATPAGMQETVFLRAHLDGPPLSALTDRLVVGSAIAAAPNYLLAEGNARYGGAGSAIYFAHRLFNGSSTTTGFDVIATSDLGWPVALLCDPDGDGRPYDSVPLPTGPLPVAINGGEHAIIVRVSVPAGARIGDASRITLRAVDAQDPAVFAEAVSDAVAALVRVHDDPRRLVSIARVPACGTAYCLTTGLPPSSNGYRFQWRDASGLLVRATDVSTDALGECVDELTFAPSQAGPGWTVAILEDAGAAWVTLDVATFAIDDELEAVSLVTGPPTYDVGASSIAAMLDVRNESFDAALAGVTLRWTVLSPDRTAILEATGSFVPYSGTEATQRNTIDLAPAEQRALPLDVSGIAFPSTGDYPIEIWRMNGCGVESLVAASVLRIIDDSDGDGLALSEEIAAGLDPLDPDSDNDGLTDGADGLADTDADGTIDALDCDSDDDGLPDGLESGMVTPGTGTDIAAGCFIPDADPLTITDPDARDTDGGGESDGREDIDHDGRADSGERDVNDPLDDAFGCSTSPPAEVADLMVRHAGDEALLSWDATRDPCTTWRVDAADTLPGLALLERGIETPAHGDASPLGPRGIRYYVVRAESWLAGTGT